ncbi:DmsE family decaheme c-type cytochrome [Telmatospirillum sp.]|uniref:DmsE family decaheme c-type cytochrome n=1 Tax=Telmatospirillum sp. TaxID=2079197 RepID=UPI00283E15C0|nr:DmsE family decaheme c-type cytochrome [Telmatospirillum sp.]MDR3437113.1 DmsE family decaheme c-type cytochrome [Telmatospirillum sp.]
MIFKKIVIGLASGLAITLCAATARAAEGPAPAAAPIFAEKGEQTCLKCHDDAPITAVLKTPHGVKGDVRTPAANHGCESCHGASPEHVASRPAKGEKKVLPAIRFSGPNASPVAERNAVCLTCHENNSRINWQGSQHASNDVACSTCHTVHATKDPVLVKASQPEKCFTCHAQQRAESFQRSHHPVREGKVSCADCHNVHGSNGPKLVKEITINDTCYNCHAEKRGPMLWEHEPVRENCDNCHTPHGSPQAAMLTERMPYLCSSCHSASGPRNSSGAWFGGHQALPGGSKNNYLVNSELQTRSCLNCHSAIHGSNSPSGEAFLR